MNTKVLLRIGLVIVAAAVVGAAFWFGARNPETANTSPSPSTSVAASPLPIAYEKAPSDWQVYSSASIGVRLSHPKDWQAGSCGEGCVAFGSKDNAAQPVIGMSITTQTLVDILAQAAPYQLLKEEVKVGAITWTKVVLQQPQTQNIFVSHFVSHKGKVYEFGLASQEAAHVAIYGQMITSFSFTK